MTSVAHVTPATAARVADVEKHRVGDSSGRLGGLEQTADWGQGHIPHLHIARGHRRDA